MLRGKVETKSLKSVYFAYVHSHLSYGILLWGNSVNADQLFIAQKRAIRIIKKASYHAPCKNWFRELGILTLPSIYILEVLKFVKRNGELFELVGEAPHYQTRYKV
jgi:hypothetical protein